MTDSRDTPSEDFAATPLGEGLSLVAWILLLVALGAGAGVRSFAWPRAAAARRRSRVSRAERFIPGLRSTAASSLPALSTRS
jgi:uncharacterized protein HemX